MYQTKPAMSTCGTTELYRKRPESLRIKLGSRPSAPLNEPCLGFGRQREEDMNAQKYAAEAIGTFWLTFAGCGSAVIAAAFPQVGIGLVGVALAFGLTVVTMAYAIGHVSGCHLNPAISVGLWAGGRFKARDLPGYIIAQVLGAVAGAGVLYLIASGKADFSTAGGFASHGYG